MESRATELRKLSDLISTKIQQMSGYDLFLTKVIAANSDEFEGPESVVARYKTLKESNERLKRSQRNSEILMERLAEVMAQH